MKGFLNRFNKMTYKELEQKCAEWINHLQHEVTKPKSKNTILQYQRALNVFLEYLKENEIEEVTKQAVDNYIDEMENQVKEYDRLKANPKPVNGKRPVSKLSTVKMRVRTLNALLDYAGQPDLKSAVKTHSQEISNINEDMLTDTDYLKILEFTDKYSNEKMKLIIETLAFTGIRISELEFITVESLKDRKPVIWNKGSRRIAFIPKKLNKKLKDYCKKNDIKSGIIFSNKAGDKMITQSYIRNEMKRIAGKARMKKSKVHPHNFRHFYAERYANMPNANHFILPKLLGHRENGQNNSVTARYVTPTSQNYLQIVDGLEAHINDRLKEAQKIRDKNKKIAEAKKKRNQKRRSQ